MRSISPVAKFRCRSAAAGRDSAVRRLDKISTKILIQIRLLALREGFSSAETRFSPVRRGNATGSAMARGTALPAEAA